MPTVSVRLNSSNENGGEIREYKADLNHILYDELERQGMVLPHGCLAGSCGSCRIEVTKGIENLSPMGVVETDTIEAIKNSYPGKDIRLSCRAKVLGDVEIKAIK